MKKKFLKLIKNNENVEDYLIGDIMLNLLDLTSIIKGMVYGKSDLVSLEVVDETQKKSQFETNFQTNISIFFKAIKELTDENHIVKTSSHDVHSFGPSVFMSDMIPNRLSSVHHLTGYQKFISIGEWEILCNHYQIIS